MTIFSFGKRIALARKRAGLTQKELAAELNIDAVTLNRYEKDHRAPDVVLFSRMVNLLKCDPEWLLFGFEPTHSKPNEVVPRKRHLDSFTPDEQEYIEKLTVIMSRATPEDIAYMKGVLDTLAAKAKAKKGA